jgi:tetratricopeptide (TPR) repeat protein
MDAIREFEVVLQVHPGPALEANACASLGVIYRELGDYAQARDYSERALRVDSETVHQRISQLSDFIAAHPAALGYLQLGLLLEGAEQLSQARSSYERALQLDAGFAPARRALAGLAVTP